MTLKKIIGVCLILLGITTFLFIAETLYNTVQIDAKSLFVYWVMGMFFYIAGSDFFAEANQRNTPEHL